MTEAILESLQHSIRDIFARMMNCEVELRGVQTGTDAAPAEIVSVMQLHARKELAGYIALHLSHVTAAAIGRYMLGEEQDPGDAEDTANEVLNIVTGRGRNQLAQIIPDVTFALPDSGRGALAEAGRGLAGHTRHMLVFALDGTEFILELCL